MDGFMILGIVLLAAGFLFVGIETIIPGFGAPGILGGCCLVAGVFLIADSVQEAVIIVAVVLLLLAVLIFTLVTLLAKGRLKTPIILNDKMNKEEGYISSTDLQYLVGKKGVVTTDLHPAGKVRIEDVEFDVISDGAFFRKRHTGGDLQNQQFITCGQKGKTGVEINPNGQPFCINK